MEALEEGIKKKNSLNPNPSSNSSSHGHALSTSSFFFNATSTSSSSEWLIDFGASYHMTKDKANFSILNECNTEQIFVSDDRFVSVVGYRTIQLDDGHFNDVLCVPSISSNSLSMYKITHSSEI